MLKKFLSSALVFTMLLSIFNFSHFSGNHADENTVVKDGITVCCNLENHD